MTRLLVVTNDFPPRAGGIQAFVHALTSRLAKTLDDVVVYAPKWPGAKEFDEQQGFDVVRHPTSLMLPVPSVARRAAAIVRERRCDAVWFGAAAPLALLAPTLRKAGATRVVATTHGHEVGWAQLPLARQALRKIGSDVDVLTYLGEYQRRKLAKVVSASASLQRLTPGVDADFFRPQTGREVRDKYGLAERRVVVCVSRLVPRKGQDVLVQAMPSILHRVPEAALLIVGGGPYRARLEKLVDQTGVRHAVRLSGGVPWTDLPAHFAAGDVFAMPCRTRRKGLDVEGLGIVYLEASASGLPVIAGNSGGAPDAVLPGETGFVVDGTDVAAVASSVVELLADPVAAREIGAAGRAWVQREWSWDAAAARLEAMLRD